MAGMNLGLQKHVVEKKLRNRGINPDSIDLEAELDSTLSLPENIQNLEEKYGRLERTGRNSKARMEKAKAQRRKQAQRNARQHFQDLPAYRRYIDKTKSAEKTFADPTSRQMKKWKENTNQYDIKGVDTRTGPERRPQTELPFQRKRERILYQGDKSDLRKSMRGIPASINRNATGQKSRARRKIDQYSELLDKSIGGGPQAQVQAMKRSAPNISEMEKLGVSKAKKLMDRDRQRMKDKIAMTEFEREERFEEFGGKLQASEGSRASEILKDSREIGTVGKKLRGSTEEKSDQESLRDGYASKKGEKTLDKWKDNYM